MPKLLIPGANPGLDREFALYVEVGALPEHIRPEMAALHCFAGWAGMASALQTGKIVQAEFNALDQAFFDELEQISGGLSVQLTGSVSYDSFYEWLQARITRYMQILATNDDVIKTTSMIVENFCDFVCKSKPPDVFKVKIRQTYETTVLNVVKLIDMHRLTVP